MDSATAKGKLGATSTPPSVGAYGEVLADDSHRFYEALRGSGGDAQLCCIDGMEHTAAVRDPTLRGAAQTLDAVIQFISRQLTGRSIARSRRP